MILDERLEFFDAALIPQSAGTSILGDVVDTSVIRDLGQGQPIYVYAIVDVVAAGGTSIILNLVTDDNSSLSTPTVVLNLTGTVLLASLTAGKKLCMVPLPIECVPYERYIGIQAVVAGTFTGAGAISCGLTLDPNGWRAYKDAVN